LAPQASALASVHWTQTAALHTFFLEICEQSVSFAQPRQRPDAQRDAAGSPQSAGCKHCTHWWAERSQRDALSGQSASAKHSTQLCTAGLHTGDLAGQSALATHATQTWCATSQAGNAAVQ
jgi:hypothetical protein